MGAFRENTMVRDERREDSPPGNSGGAGWEGRDRTWAWPVYLPLCPCVSCC